MIAMSCCDTLWCLSLGVPYEFDFESSHKHWNDDSVLTQVTRLTRTYSSYVNRVNLLQQMTPMTNFIFLDKVLLSQLFVNSFATICCDTFDKILVFRYL